MGLDDFTEESASKEEKERKEELSENTPPGDDSKWHEYEPGTPDWLSFISGGETRNENLVDLERGAAEIFSEDVLVINIEGVDSTSLRSGKYVELEEKR